MSGSRRSRSLALSPMRSRAKTETEATPEPEADQLVVLLDPDAPVVASLAELRASARRRAHEAFLRAAPFVVDAPARGLM